MNNKEILIYLAGFIDGDGCINAQIVRRKDYKLGFQIRVSIAFFQKTSRYFFIEWIHSIIKCGVIRIRKDGISEYTIIGIKNVRPFLEKISPFLIVKKKQSDLLLEIMKEMELNSNKDKSSFLNLCKKVDLFMSLNDSKKRTMTSNVVETFFNK